MDLNKLKVFKCVAEFGKINLASTYLKIAPSAISVSISLLEDEIGYKLFDRHYKGMKLTTKGSKLYAVSKKIFRDIDNFLEEIKEEGNGVKGSLRVSTSQGIASSHWFNSKLAILSDKYPELQIKVIDYKEGNIDSIDADIFLCPFIYDRLDFIQQKISDVCFKLFASRQYIERFGLPKEAEDLDNHRLISFAHEFKNPFNNADLLLHNGRKDDNLRKIFLYVNNSIGLVRLVKMGVGIGSLHVTDVSEDNLVAVLGKKNKIIISTYLAYHKKNKDSQNIKAFSDTFLKNYGELTEI